MYNLDINFLKDRGLNEQSKETLTTKKPTTPLETKIPMFLGLGIMIAIPAVVFGYVGILNNQNKNLAQENQEIQAEIQKIVQENEAEKKIQEEIQKVQEDIDSYASVFEQIKPSSALFQEITNVIPENVGIDSLSIQQGGGGRRNNNPSPGRTRINISGIASSYDLVNDFVLTLQNSEFFDAEATELLSATLNEEQPTLERNPNNNSDNTEENEVEFIPTITVDPIIQYRITTQVMDTPSSSLIQQLRRNNDIGLVNRILILQEQGVIQ